jgi:alpha-glucosidase
MSARRSRVIALSFAAGLACTLAQVAAQVVSESVGAKIARFYENTEAASKALPSQALDKPLTSTGPSSDVTVHPAFSRVEGKASVHVDIAPGTSLYGTGSCTGPLLRNGRVTQTWNFDNYGYSDPSPNLYQSHPWVLAVRADGTSFGVLADTTFRTTIDLSSGIQFTADGPSFPVIVIERPTPQEVVMALADLTGKIEMPPLWAIGYHQCRYSYYPEARVRQIAEEFRKRRIPCDVIWHDIDYMRGFRCFTFDPQHFPDPAKLNADLHAQGFHTVWMIDPGIKAEPGYFVYDQMMAGDHAVKNAQGKVYNGEVWPGVCVFPDFTRHETRQWWAGLYKDFIGKGIDGVWNDMNEPAVFNVKTKTMPEDNIHRPDPEIAGPADAPVTHARFHNVYGKLMVTATREGVMAANPDKRPFVLSRANYIGGNKFAAMWSGDNTADWQHLEESIPMSINMGLSAQPFNGPDIGGFAGNGPEGQEGKLFARWMGFGAMMPFSRGHTGKGNIDKEPWAFGAEVEKTCRQALERRYRLLPYFYTLFHEAHETGMPVLRPLFFADPADAALRTEDDAFLLGRDLLVIPQVTPDNLRVPVLPKGAWRSFDWGEGLNVDLPGLRLRGGAILPTGPVVQFVGEKAMDEITLIVSLDGEGQASGVLYEDAGDGWGFKRGEYRVSTFAATREGGAIVVKRAKVDGQLAPANRKINVRVLTEHGELRGSGTEAEGARIVPDVTK